MIRYPGWTKLWLEIERNVINEAKFSGVLYCKAEALLFKLNFVIPIDQMTFKEKNKPVYIRRVLFQIEITDLNGEAYSLIDDSDYEFFYNILVEYAIQLYYDIKSNKIGDRTPCVSMRTSNCFRKKPLIKSDIFSFLIKTEYIPESLLKRPKKLMAP